VQAAFGEDWAFYLQMVGGRKYDRGGNQNHSMQLQFASQMENAQGKKKKGETFCFSCLNSD